MPQTVTLSASVTVPVDELRKALAALDRRPRRAPNQAQAERARTDEREAFDALLRVLQRAGALSRSDLLAELRALRHGRNASARALRRAETVGAVRFVDGAWELTEGGAA